MLSTEAEQLSKSLFFNSHTFTTVVAPCHHSSWQNEAAQAKKPQSCGIIIIPQKGGDVILDGDFPRQKNLHFPWCSTAYFLLVALHPILSTFTFCVFISFATGVGHYLDAVLYIPIVVNIKWYFRCWKWYGSSSNKDEHPSPHLVCQWKYDLII